jgi:hypothetical protein
MSYVVVDVYCSEFSITWYLEVEDGMDSLT